MSALADRIDRLSQRPLPRAERLEHFFVELLEFVETELAEKDEHPANALAALNRGPASGNIAGVCQAARITGRPTLARK